MSLPFGANPSTSSDMAFELALWTELPVRLPIFAKPLLGS